MLQFRGQCQLRSLIPASDATALSTDATVAEGTDRDVRAWQGPPLPQRGFGTDEPVSQPGAAKVSYIRPPTLVLEATRKAENMSEEASSAKKHGLRDRNCLNIRTLLRRTRKLQEDCETERKVSGHHQACNKLDKSLRRDLDRTKTMCQTADNVRAHRIQ
ncbi:hypothetical protein MTO96_000246 [Rhipicephalus appendiculatus]